MRADTDAAAIQLRAFAARGGEQFLAQRVIYHAVLHAAAALYADRHRELRKAMQEVRRAVQRIDDPGELFLLAGFAARMTAFLGEHRMLRIVLANDFDDR